MDQTAGNRLVPYGQLAMGREAVYSGKPFTKAREDWPLTIRDDGNGNEILEWSLHPWLWPEMEDELKPHRDLLDHMQASLGPLGVETRKIRAHV